MCIRDRYIPGIIYLGTYCLLMWSSRSRSTYCLCWVRSVWHSSCARVGRSRSVRHDSRTMFHESNHKGKCIRLLRNISYRQMYLDGLDRSTGSRRSRSSSVRYLLSSIGNHPSSVAGSRLCSTLWCRCSRSISVRCMTYFDRYQPSVAGSVLCSRLWSTWSMSWPRWYVSWSRCFISWSTWCRS